MFLVKVNISFRNEVFRGGHGYRVFHKVSDFYRVDLSVVLNF